MLQSFAMPQGPGAAAAGSARLDDVLRLPPGPRREREILRLVAGLSAALASLHETGGARGDISPGAVADDGTGGAILAQAPAAMPDDEDAVRHAGYAAFEQYTDDPAYPCGPWTDVYGLAALARFLATGEVPPDALARRVRDDYLPLEEWQPGAYGAAFCAAVDGGLAQPAHARPRTAMELAEAMGALAPPVPAQPAPAPGQASAPASNSAPAVPTSLPASAPPPLPLTLPNLDLDSDLDLVPDLSTPSLMAAAAADELAEPPPAGDRLTAMRSEHPARGRRALPFALALVLLGAAGGYAWFQSAQPNVQLAGAPQAQPAPTSPPAPAAATPAAPAAADKPAPGPTAAQEPTPASAPASTSAPEPSIAPESAPASTPEPTTTPTPAPAAAAAASAELGPRVASELAPGVAPGASEPVAQTPPPPAPPVTVSVAVRPWGEVLINGRSRGVSPPLRELSLAPGRYQVTLRNASAGDHRMTLTVTAGRPASIVHEFK
ncbi:hypothetical protein [Achromobacter anxifer]|uniref:hypothetical protein n=1 Tax=Achromobacter anxifer TaxID=1287737 RepID=UPI0023F9922E|nr:hypothetical protein [Achromobacter anxifer]MDF8365509.1 hypothetical protein [Achromobacter anxifer]